MKVQLKNDCCPKCGSTQGYAGTMTETHEMHGYWGYQPEAVDSGVNVRVNTMRCVSCGYAFRLDAKSRQDWERLPDEFYIGVTNAESSSR
jgi:ribosomal protein S27AE